MKLHVKTRPTGSLYNFLHFFLQNSSNLKVWTLWFSPVLRFLLRAWQIASERVDSSKSECERTRRNSDCAVIGLEGKLGSPSRREGILTRINILALSRKGNPVAIRDQDSYSRQSGNAVQGQIFGFAIPVNAIRPFLAWIKGSCRK